MLKSKENINNLLEQIEVITSNISVFLNSVNDLSLNDSKKLNAMFVNRKELIDNILRLMNVNSTSNPVHSVHINERVIRLQKMDKDNLEKFQIKINDFGNKIKDLTKKKSLLIYNKM